MSNQQIVESDNSCRRGNQKNEKGEGVETLHIGIGLALHHFRSFFLLEGFQRKRKERKDIGIL